MVGGGFREITRVECKVVEPDVSFAVTAMGTPTTASEPTSSSPGVPYIRRTALSMESQFGGLASEYDIGVDEVKVKGENSKENDSATLATGGTSELIGNETSGRPSDSQENSSNANKVSRSAMIPLGEVRKRATRLRFCNAIKRMKVS